MPEPFVRFLGILIDPALNFKTHLNFISKKLKRSLCTYFLCSAKIYNAKALKGNVSRDVRWVLLYIIRKLSMRRGDANNIILLLLKGQFTIYIKQSSVSTAGQFSISQLKLKYGN
jgi:hypothetical protein